MFPCGDVGAAYQCCSGCYCVRSTVNNFTISSTIVGAKLVQVYGSRFMGCSRER
jgi:hypothetical protein